ncbi:MAG: exosortase T, partial [Pseudomonadota bacterium]
MDKLHNIAVPLAIAIASLILAAEPIAWLVRSWQDPSYQSVGHWYLFALVALIVASVLSGPTTGIRNPGSLLLIFLAAATFRLLGQIFAVNILAALALAIDVFAITRWLGIDRRPLALSPMWLSTFFLFALPLAPVLERVLGFPLQMLSAEVACHMLNPFFADLFCEGVRLKVSGVDVLVDLPCSGATGLMILLALWTGLNAWHRPKLWDSSMGLAGVLIAAILGNGLRISLLAGGLALGVDTMAPVLHTAIGLLTLGLTGGAVLLLYRPRARAAHPPGPGLNLPQPVNLCAAVVTVVASLWIVHAPKTPIDRSGSVTLAELPAQLLGARKIDVALTETEEHYFTAYGGLAQKAQYGALVLKLVQTGKPLRHLQPPETCHLSKGFS